MNNNTHAVLILGGTGRTGSLLAGKLARRGIAARTASRRGSDVRFDWDDPAPHAEAAGVRHVPFLSAYNADQAPESIDIAAVEAGLAARQSVTHSVLRPAWVMQNFSDDHLPVIDGVITAPSGGGAEAFVDADDIAAVAAETLLDPGAHAGAQYTLTGPQALTFGEVADIIASVSRRPVSYNDIDQEAWISGALAAGVPADYAVMLRWLTGAIIAGSGSGPTDDIEKVTGRPPATFRGFAERHPHAWTVAAK